MIKVIGIAGYARCGKDTFVGISKNILTKNGFSPLRVAFADKLKGEVQNMLEQKAFKSTVYTEDSEAKKLIRPLLVWWGCQRRYESDGGLYWVNEVDRQLRQHAQDVISRGEDPSKVVALVSDVRFPNEAKWVHEQWGGIVVHLKRYVNEWRKGGQDGSDEYLTKVYDNAPNEEEAKQDPLVQELADHRVEWESRKKMLSADAIADSYLQTVVADTLNQTRFFKLPEPVTGILSL